MSAYESEPTRGTVSEWREVSTADGRRRAARWNWRSDWSTPRWDVATWSGALPLIETDGALIEWAQVDTRTDADALLMGFGGAQ